MAKKPKVKIITTKQTVLELLCKDKEIFQKAEGKLK